MSFIIAGLCLIAVAIILWQIYCIDRDPEIPGPVSHVIVPAFALPIAAFLSLIAVLAMAHGVGWIEWP